MVTFHSLSGQLMSISRTFVSIMRIKVSIALGAWIVENTKWPLIAVLITICAVSSSLISPIITTSGSWRKIVGSVEEKVIPILLFTWTWLAPSSSYSTGS